MMYSIVTMQTRTFDVKYYNPPFDVKEDHGTMHISILTADNQAVSLTSTVNLGFGSKIM
jgi:gamma-glutamyltranspeptidase / glutathione hydrolase / leukotriene-C4 hydrolase